LYESQVLLGENDILKVFVILNIFSCRVAPAEHLPASEGSADLVLVVEALHWFDLPAFFAEVDRILRPGGILAVLG